ncbi:MAG: hypothetical protein ACFFEF_11470 [Candidatus Thorarchaeota archaeon]
MKSKSTITVFLVFIMFSSIFVVNTMPITEMMVPNVHIQQTEHLPSEAPSISPPHILVYTEFVNQTAGEEFENTMTAINNTYGTNYQLTALVNFTLLDSLLPGKDILLIPEQESANVTKMKAVGTYWASTLTTFVEDGGVVVMLDFGNEAAPGLGLHIYNESGLMQFGPVLGQYPSAALTEMHRHTFGDALGRKVTYRWTPRSHTFAVTNTDGTNVFDDYSTNNRVVIHKIMGHGHIVFMAFDMSDADQYYEQILGNAIRLPNHVVFDASQQTEYTWTNERVDQYYTDDHPAIAFVEDLVEAGFAVSRMDTFSAAFLNASDVVICPIPHSSLGDYNAGEIAILNAFVANGGSIFIQSDWSTYGDDIRALANNFGYDWARDDLWDTDDAMNWYYESQIAYTGDNILSHPITYNVSRVEFYASDGFTTLPPNAERIIVTDWDNTVCWGEGGWYDNWLGAYGITLMAVSTYGAGKVSVVLDSNFMDSITYPLDEDQDNDGVIDYFDSDNDVLLLNTIHWLAGNMPENDAPLLSDLTHTPSSPSNGDPVNVTVTATDSDGLANITCHYRLNGGEWQNVSMTPEGGDIYSAEIGTFYDTDFQDFYIRAFDGSVDPIESVTSVVHLNGINYFPTTPMLYDPGTTDDDGVFLLNWTASSDFDGYIDHYDIQVADSTWFTNIMDEITAYTDDYEMMVFVNDTYYFRVRAVDDNGIAGFWCFPQNLYVQIITDVTGPTISTPVISPSAPKHGDSVTIYAGISDPRDVKNATCYYNANNGTWQSAVMTLGTGDEYSCNIGSYSVDDVVYYYIEAYDNSTNLNMENTSVYSFTVFNQPPDAPILIDPGSIISVDTFVLDWTDPYDLEGAIDHFIVQMSADSAFSLILGEWNVTSSQRLFTAMTNGIYYFRVLTVDDHGAYSVWSNAESIEIQVGFTTPTTTTTTTTTDTSTTTTTGFVFNIEMLNLIFLFITAGSFTIIIIVVVAIIKQRSRKQYTF